MEEWSFGWGVSVVGFGYVWDIDERSGKILFTPDQSDGLQCSKRRDAVLLQAWVVGRMPGHQVGVYPFVRRSLPEDVAWSSS